MSADATSYRMRQARLGPLWITHTSGFGEGRGGLTVCLGRFYLWPRSREKRSTR